MLRRSNLETRFRRSAQPVGLQEFLEMIWPGLKDEDMKIMHRWAQLREAFSVLTNPNFGAMDSELRRIFDLLVAPKGQDMLPLGELVRARVIPKDEVLRLASSPHGAVDLFHRVNFEDFKMLTQPYLKTTYVSPETEKLMKAEEELLSSNKLESTFKSEIGKAIGRGGSY